MSLEPRTINKPYLSRDGRAIPPNGIARSGPKVTIDYVRQMIFSLHKDTDLWQAKLSDALTQVLGTAVAALGNQVASVWQMNKEGTEMYCIAQYEEGIGAVEPSGILRRDDYPAYFRSVIESSVTGIEDCLDDIRTADLVKPYLLPHNINAIMISTLRREGSVFGALMLEQLGETRAWTSAEKELTISVTELINQLMLVCELRKQNQLLGLLNSITNDSGSGHSPDSLARLGMTKLSQVFPDVWAGFYRIYDNRKTAKLTCFVGQEVPEFARSAIEEIPIKDGFLRTVTELGEIFVIPDCETWADSVHLPIVDIAVAVGMKSVTSIPLQSSGEILAFIQVWSRDKIYNFEVDYEGYKAIAATFAVDYAKAVNLERLNDETRLDSLTGLYNRDKLQIDVEKNKAEETNLLLLVDLKNFKQVNDTLGRISGDRILISMAARLSVFADSFPNATAYRLHGAEFCLLVVGNSDSSENIANMIHECISSPVEVNGLHIVLHPVIGVAQSPDHGRDGVGLLRSADVALGWAKKAEAGISLYEPDKDNLGPGNLELLAELREAINRDEIELYYQPQMDLTTGQISAVEALLRWRHKEYGLIDPETFVEVAESGDLIRSLTSWVARHAISQISIFKLIGITVPFTLNVSARDIVDCDFPGQIKALLEEFGVEPRDLRLELTEDTLMADPERALEVISEFERLGLEFDIDDFGLGYSSISYLRKLPLNSIKIDNSFVANVSNDERNRAVIRSVVGMAHGLGAKVVAEAVEDEETAKTLRSLGCDIGQGFHFVRPLSAAEFISRVDQWIEPIS